MWPTLLKGFSASPSSPRAHQKEYLLELADEFHFEVIYYEEVITRQQNNAPVYGHLFILELQSSPGIIRINT